METTHKEFQTHYKYISHIIDFLTAFNDGHKILEETSQNSMVELIRMLHMLIMLIRTSDHFETFAKFVHECPEDPEGPYDPFAPENPETWPVIEEEQRRKDKEEIN